MYIISAFIFLFNIKRIKDIIIDNKYMFIIIFIFIIFSVMGFINNNGQYFKGVLYSIRVCMQLVSTIVFATALKYKFNNKNDVLNLILSIFFIYTVIGWIIFILYPESYKLWQDLSKYGITFIGDPHVSRFMGTFFDPNFVGAIISLPVIISIYMYFNYNGKYTFLYLASIIYFSLCIFFTYSRSGLLSIVICVILIILNYFRKVIFNKEKINFKAKILLAISALAFIGIIIFQGDSIIRLISRFTNIFNDPSAQHRFDDFEVGFKYLKSSKYILLLGIGYNNIQYNLGTGLSALDSSVLNTLVCFGIIGTSLLIYTIYRFLINIYKKVSDKKLFYYLIIYLISSIVVCNFNNLLYYQFFIILIFTILNFLYISDLDT